MKYFNIKRTQIIRNNLKITNKNRKDVLRDRNFEKTNQDSVNGDPFDTPPPRRKFYISLIEDSFCVG